MEEFTKYKYHHVLLNKIINYQCQKYFQAHDDIKKTNDFPKRFRKPIDPDRQEKNLFKPRFPPN